MTLPPITYTPEEAHKMGYQSITKPFEHSEKSLFDSAMSTLASADHVVVLDRLKRPEIYRRKSELKETTERDLRKTYD